MTSFTERTVASADTRGLPSKIIAFVAALFAILWGALDVNYHGHFSCDTNLKLVRAELARRTHLKDYLGEMKDYAGQVETGTVTCECANRKVVLRGKVVNDNIRSEFSDVAALAVGTDKVDNQIETLNEDALGALQKLLQSPPTNMTMNYQVKDRGTIYLTGDLPSPELKETIGNLVAKIRGVRSVVNDLGRELQVQRMIRIHNIYFDFNKWEIRSQSHAVLDE